jgi:toxin ParE1/3/4
MPILFTPAAEVDLSDIWKYTVDTWGENQAEEYIQKLSLACSKLSDGLSQEIPVDYVRSGYRKVLVGRHAIFFKRNENEITIIRILHQSMDVDEVL